LGKSFLPNIWYFLYRSKRQRG